MKKYKGSGLRNGMAIIRDKNGKPLFNLPTFIPDQSLVENVNFAFHRQSPLLVTGEKHRRDMVASAIAYEFYGNNFMPHYTRWMMPRNASFSDCLYTFNNEKRIKDLEYHRLDPENYPIKNQEHYLQEGPLLSIWKKLNEQPQIPPMLEIRNAHRGSENFIEDLMYFLTFVPEIKIPELDLVIEKKFYNRPYIILTAESGFELPEDYEGTIYNYELPEQKKEVLLQETLTEVSSWWNLEETPLTKEGWHDESQAVLIGNDQKFPAFQLLVEKFVDLYYLIKNNNLLQPGNITFPMSILELRNTITYKAIKALIDKEPIEEEIKKIEQLIDAQYEMTQSIDLSASLEIIRDNVKNARLDEALRSLELIKNKLPAELQNEVIQLISRHRELVRTEMLGTESTLLLYPQKNKLTFDLLQFLDRI